MLLANSLNETRLSLILRSAYNYSANSECHVIPENAHARQLLSSPLYSHARQSPMARARSTRCMRRPQHPPP
jgi:hypothetical protein